MRKRRSSWLRRHTLLALDDCLDALQPAIPHLTRSSPRRRLRRHGISRPPVDVEQMAQSPGGGSFCVLRRVTPPLLASYLVTAFSLSFALPMGELGATGMVYPPNAAGGYFRPDRPRRGLRGGGPDNAVGGDDAGGVTARQPRRATGLFILTGIVAAEHAGPAVVLSFLVAAVGCAFAGMCYAELASMLPMAGSA